MFLALENKYNDIGWVHNDTINAIKIDLWN